MGISVCSPRDAARPLSANLTAFPSPPHLAYFTPFQAGGCSGPRGEGRRGNPDVHGPASTAFLSVTILLGLGRGSVVLFVFAFLVDQFGLNSLFTV